MKAEGWAVRIADIWSTIDMDSMGEGGYALGVSRVQLTWIVWGREGMRWEYEGYKSGRHMEYN